MTFEEAIRSRMRNWPAISPHRAAVLEWFFLVYGGGAYWAEDGTVATYDDRGPDDPADPFDWEKKLYAESIAEKRRNELPEFLQETLERAEDRHTQRLARMRDLLDNLEERASGVPCHITSHFFALRENHPCCLLYIPDNCPPDWVMGAREMCALILACPFEETEFGDLAGSQRVAKKVLKDLDERFGAAPLPDVSYATWEEEHPFSETVENRRRIKEFMKELEEERKRDADAT